MRLNSAARCYSGGRFATPAVEIKISMKLLVVHTFGANNLEASQSGEAIY